MSDPSPTSHFQVGDRCTWRTFDNSHGYGRWIITPVVVRKVGPKRIYVEGRARKTHGTGDFAPTFRWVTPDKLFPRSKPAPELGEVE